jgi:hypothetical protein
MRPASRIMRPAAGLRRGIWRAASTAKVAGGGGAHSHSECVWRARRQGLAAHSAVHHTYRPSARNYTGATHSPVRPPARPHFAAPISVHNYRPGRSLSANTHHTWRRQIANSPARVVWSPRPPAGWNGLFLMRPTLGKTCRISIALTTRWATSLFVPIRAVVLSLLVLRDQTKLANNDQHQGWQDWGNGNPVARHLTYLSVKRLLAYLLMLLLRIIFNYSINIQFIHFHFWLD